MESLKKCHILEYSAYLTGNWRKIAEYEKFVRKNFAYDNK